MSKEIKHDEIAAVFNEHSALIKNQLNVAALLAERIEGYSKRLLDAGYPFDGVTVKFETYEDSEDGTPKVDAVLFEILGNEGTSYFLIKVGFNEEIKRNTIILCTYNAQDSKYYRHGEYEASPDGIDSVLLIIKDNFFERVPEAFHVAPKAEVKGGKLILK